MAEDSVMNELQRKIHWCEGEIAGLKHRLQEYKDKIALLTKQRSTWPKLIRLAAVTPQMALKSTLQEECNWYYQKGDAFGPCPRGALIGADVFLTYRLEEDGRVTFVGAEDVRFGSVGKQTL